MTTKNIATKNLQDKFLYDLINSNKTVELNLINGLVISCKLEKFDNFSLLINYNNSLTLVYKHSISFISYTKILQSKGLIKSYRRDPIFPKPNIPTVFLYNSLPLS